DADFAVFAPDEEWTVRAADPYHRNQITAYDSRTARGRATRTLLRAAAVDFDEPRGALLSARSPAHSRKGRPDAALEASGPPSSGVRRRSGAELGAQASDVALGVDVVFGPGHGSVLGDDEGRAQSAVEGAVADRLLPVAAIGLRDLGAGVGQERERQVLVGGEGPDRLGVIGGDADHVEAGGGQRRQVVAEVAGLGRAAGRGGLRVEVDDDLPAGEVRLRVGPSVGIGQGE